MSWTTIASSSLKRFRNQAGILSDPVAFLEFKCFSVALTWPTDGTQGNSFLKSAATSARLGMGLGRVKAVPWPCKLFCSCSRVLVACS